ncbi:MAG TPA: ATP-binding protein [Pyrinomonadaceae bacterium]|nr:ATP-binding protein [Pyrinomonadaceae bacterium]
MTLLEALQLIGYSLGAVLPIWMGYLLFRKRLGVVPIQHLLLALGLCMVGWHAGNLVVTLRSLFGVDHAQWDVALRLANTIAVISITFCYSLLLHVHIHLWASAHGRELTQVERVRIYLSYIPCLFLVLVLPRIWTGPYQPMIGKVSVFVFPFALWVTYSLAVISITELMVARRADSESERRILHTLAASFIVIACLILASLGLGLGRGTIPGQYLQTIANLGSLLPSALLTYYIYRYRYLELIIKESLIVAIFASVVLAVYVYGIRRIADWTNARYGLRAGVVEAILILALTLLAAPLRGWLERSFRSLFQRETALYRDVVAHVSGSVGQYRSLNELLTSIESQTANALSLGRVKIALEPDDQNNKAEAVSGNGDQTPPQSGEPPAGYNLSYALTRENQNLGLLLIEASPNALTPDVRAVLEVLAGQIAVAIEDYRLLEKNVRLERKLAEGERLAALGQMAATVAHEVKNPLSAIKSIAQVMKEDEGLNEQHARDLSLIVGETDRLSKSVTQLLSFARNQPPAAVPCEASELVHSVTALFRADAEERNISLQCVVNGSARLDGMQTAAVRDALANLVLNALQATPARGQVTIESSTADGLVTFCVADDGPGIAAELRARIWEPFFTTRQRGTGLGLAIVRKRMEEAGGSAKLISSKAPGATFELSVPVSSAG